MSEKKNEIEVRKNNSSPLTDLSSLEQIEEFGERVIKSKLTPFKEASDAVAAILIGRELGIGPMTAVNHINCIQGRASVDIHIITAKLLQAGVTYSIKKDFEQLHEYRTKDAVTYQESLVLNNLDKFQIITTKTVKEDYKIDKIQVIKVAIDTITEIEFTRQVKQPDGSYTKMVVPSKVSWSDIRAMGLDEKDNWIKMPKIMLRTRCLAIGGRLIASDFLLGIYENSEVADANNIPYKVDADDGRVTIEVVAEEVKE